ncbi:hypothetical protein PR048_022468 [Dryococelus australis]|uniref:Uncharacterized protein n=1 Tax=Dryococelus australis TaxID=614101 RepID=A0ABQ9H159_9NEOP|nr:hypothetical protein PR048_022468 [Dryococelus australis]
MQKRHHFGFLSKENGFLDAYSDDHSGARAGRCRGSREAGSDNNPASAEHPATRRDNVRRNSTGNQNGDTRSKREGPSPSCLTTHERSWSGPRHTSACAAVCKWGSTTSGTVVAGRLVCSPPTKLGIMPDDAACRRVPWSTDLNYEILVNILPGFHSLYGHPIWFSHRLSIFFRANAGMVTFFRLWMITLPWSCFSEQRAAFNDVTAEDRLNRPACLEVFPALETEKLGSGKSGAVLHRQLLYFNLKLRSHGASLDESAHKFAISSALGTAASVQARVKASWLGLSRQMSAIASNIKGLWIDTPENKPNDNEEEILEDNEDEKPSSVAVPPIDKLHQVNRRTISRSRFAEPRAVVTGISVHQRGLVTAARRRASKQLCDAVFARRRVVFFPLHRCDPIR